MYIWLLRRRKWNGECKQHSASFDKDLLLAEVKGQDPHEWDICCVSILGKK